MPDWALTRAHVARESRETETAAKTPSKVDDESVTAFRNEVVSPAVQGLAEPHPECTGEVRHSQQPDTRRCNGEHRALGLPKSRTWNGLVS